MTFNLRKINRNQKNRQVPFKIHSGKVITVNCTESLNLSGKLVNLVQKENMNQLLQPESLEHRILRFQFSVGPHKNNNTAGKENNKPPVAGLFVDEL